MVLVERLQGGAAECVLEAVWKDVCFGGWTFRRPFGRYGLECLSICDGLGCLPTFGVAADEVSVV